MAKLQTKSDIDVVITWVDGNDPKHQEKLNKSLVNISREKIPGANKTRFASVNEIKYCVLSILKFAPFVRKIFIITDDQNPNINEDIKTFFPDKQNCICIVDHREIFEGLEQFLPTFNSLSIETFMWRIKDLSDKFVYFNDDFFLVRAIKPEDWFINNRPVMRGVWKPRPTLILQGKNLLRFLKKIFLQKKEVNIKPKFKISQWWSAEIMGFKKKYFKINHTPHPIDRTQLETFYTKNKSIFLKNASLKFRHYTQFNPVTLANHLEITSGNNQSKPYDLIVLKPVNRHFDYVNKKIHACSNQQHIKFMCAQSLDLATEEDIKKLLNWMESILKI